MKLAPFLILPIGLLTSITIKAQTNTFPVNGNAGLGTLTPTSWFSDKVLQIEGVRPTLRFAPSADGDLGTILFKGKFSDGLNGSPDEFHLNYHSSYSSPFITLGSYKNVPKTVISFQGTGNIGIGTDSPEEILEIKSNRPVMTLHQPGLASFKTGIDNGVFKIAAMDNGYGGHGGSFSANNNQVLSMTTIGNVGIGTLTPAEKLSVNGKIRAKEIKVEATNWPDYVFEDGYKIGTLGQLESYLKMHKRLPEIPSAKEVESDGVALGEMNKMLLKKIEELTLFLIEKDKEIQELKKQVSKIAVHHDSKN